MVGETSVNIDSRSEFVIDKFWVSGKIRDMTNGPLVSNRQTNDPRTQASTDLATAPHRDRRREIRALRSIAQRGATGRAVQGLTPDRRTGAARLAGSRPDRAAGGLRQLRAP